ncbi:DUF1674 domain-containing protein [Eilatimonas milleporae]|nr:succinate dehydrogenase assembly factor 4 [Eilatimonas milleporae]
MTDRDTTEKTDQPSNQAKPEKEAGTRRPKEIGGRDGPEPTRYGDWEKNGIISDF